MNQAMAFGLVFGGGFLLTSALTGSSLSDIAKGNAGAVGTTGQQLSGGVGGVGQAIASTALKTVGGYVDPFAAAKSVTPERVDQGQDFSLAPGSPIVAPGDSTFLGTVSNWYAGQPYLAFRLTSGPMAGRNYYVAEQINPAPGLTPGATVKQGNPVGYFAARGTGIEMGWAGQTDWRRTLAQEQGNTGGPGHSNSPAGLSFHQFLTDIGAVK